MPITSNHNQVKPDFIPEGAPEPAVSGVYGKPDYTPGRKVALPTGRVVPADSAEGRAFLAGQASQPTAPQGAPAAPEEPEATEAPAEAPAAPEIEPQPEQDPSQSENAGDESQADPRREELAGRTKADLLEIARGIPLEGVTGSMTKADIIDRIVASGK